MGQASDPGTDLENGQRAVTNGGGMRRQAPQPDADLTFSTNLTAEKPLVEPDEAGQQSTASHEESSQTRTLDPSIRHVVGNRAFQNQLIRIFSEHLGLVPRRQPDPHV